MSEKKFPLTNVCEVESSMSVKTMIKETKRLFNTFFINRLCEISVLMVTGISKGKNLLVVSSVC